MSETSFTCKKSSEVTLETESIRNNKQENPLQISGVNLYWGWVGLFTEPNLSKNQAACVF